MDNLSNEQIKELFYMSIDKYNDHMNNPKCGKLVKVLNASFLYKMSQAVVEIESGEKQEGARTQLQGPPIGTAQSDAPQPIQQAIPEHPEVAEHASAQIRNTPPHGFQTDGTFEGDTAADVYRFMAANYR
ncbi:hypothetical protein L3Y34_013324 [Caenorhabditis briggsae]|uniref:Uncharacterized protein n=1 Tax=Caenorhabditis briggsae TaxID=6238 RepID=A0AAE8ZUN2_CAEBR|nr:hypothetical protein L3Y34_013324 [Caenorhabditis briggsae]